MRCFAITLYDAVLCKDNDVVWIQVLVVQWRVMQQSDVHASTLVVRLCGVSVWQHAWLERSCSSEVMLIMVVL